MCKSESWSSTSSPTPPVRRALKHAVEKLQEAGHEIVDWEPELHQEAMDLLVSVSKVHVYAKMFYQSLDLALKDLPVYHRGPDFDWLRRQAQFFVADGAKSVRDILAPVDEPFREEMLPYAQAKEIGVHEMWQLQAKRSKLCKDYLDRWSQAGLDGILCKCNCVRAHGRTDRKCW